MIDQLGELYRDVILQHYKNSTHAGELPKPAVSCEGANPLCGDELAVYLLQENGRIAKARFKGKGCAISQAAASMLMEQLEGKDIPGAEKLIDSMKGLMQGRQPDPSVDLGDLEALEGVRKFPVRIKCAALSWNVVEDALGLKNKEVGS